MKWFIFIAADALVALVFYLWPTLTMAAVGAVVVIVYEFGRASGVRSAHYGAQRRWERV